PEDRFPDYDCLLAALAALPIAGAKAGPEPPAALIDDEDDSPPPAALIDDQDDPTLPAALIDEEDDETESAASRPSGRAGRTPPTRHDAPALAELDLADLAPLAEDAFISPGARRSRPERHVETPGSGLGEYKSVETPGSGLGGYKVEGEVEPIPAWARRDEFSSRPWIIGGAVAAALA